MRLLDVYNIIEEIAPKRLSDEYCVKFNAYDNSGILVDAGEAIDKIVFSLDFSFSAIEKAVEEKASLLLTHHPAIYSKIGEIRADALNPLGAKLALCLKNGISVISTHLNLDVAKEGIDQSLCEGISLSAGAGMKPTGLKYMHALNEVGYGRVYDVKEISLDSLAEQLKKTFETERVEIYGAKKKKIKKVASFCGGGADEEAVAFAKANSADVIISSDFKHHVLLLAKELGVSVITLTHYASENYGFEKFYKKISQKVALPCIYVKDKDLI